MIFSILTMLCFHLSAEQTLHMQVFATLHFTLIHGHGQGLSIYCVSQFLTFADMGKGGKARTYFRLT